MRAIEVDTDGLRKAECSYDGAGQEVDEIRRTLGGSPAVARFYGDDEPGRAFAKGYVEPLFAFLQSLRDLAASMAGTAGSVVDTAHAFDRANVEAAAALSEMAGAMTYGHHQGGRR